MRSLFVALIALLSCQCALAQLSLTERQGIRDALSIGNMRESDLNFARNPFFEKTRIPLIDLALDHTLDATDAVMELHTISRGGTSASLMLQTLIEKVYQHPLSSLQHDPPVTGLEELSDELRAPILGLANWINSANNEIKRATAGLTADEKRALIESLPVWAVEEPTVKFSFVKGKTLAKGELFRLLAKVDTARIRSAAARLSEAVERAILLIKQSKSDITETIRTKVDGMPIVISGRGDDEHTESDAVLTIDLGGDDHYTGRHGAGVGYASVLIDLDGNDTYRVGDLNIGAAILGIGLAYDLGGDDLFQGGSLTLGSGLAGVGVLWKSGGRDVYRSHTLSQGYGQYGIGLLIDTGGNDNYDVALYGQGAARTEGIGWLIDQTGRDEYRAGGLVLNSPLFATAHYSFAQGFGMGYREDTGGIRGGIGLITDWEGDDTYIGETYQQAAAYWFSIGSLYDNSGNDTYTGYHYCQSSAMHMCATFFFDLGGDDGYIVKVGASHAIGHDYGVAVMLDRAGDDVYASRDSTPGVGNANGLGLFVDADGIDRYFGPPGKGNGARGTGSLGVFADLNGSDVYKFGLADGEARSTNLWGVALDRPTKTTETIQAQQRAKPVPGSEKMPAESEMATLYQSAVQWGVGTAQDEVADSLDRIVRIGEPALKWMLDNRLKDADRLHVRAFVYVVQALGVGGGNMVGAKAFSASDGEMLPLLRIATDAKVMDFGAVLPGLFKKPSLAMQAVVAAGTLMARAAVPDLMALCRNSDKLLARAAMVSLQQIGDPASIGTAQAMLVADDLMTRKAALALLVQFPEAALTSAENLIKSTDEFRCRVGVEILGALGSDDSLARIGQMLGDPRTGVRIECLLRLEKRCPKEFISTYIGLRNDPVEMVRSVAIALKPD